MQILLDTSRTTKEAKEEAIRYVREHSVDKQVIMTVTGTANCKIDYHALSERGESGMWRVFEETREEGKAELVVELLEEVDQVSERLREQIMKEKDPVVLRKWCRIAAQVMSVEEFQKRYQEI